LRRKFDLGAILDHTCGSEEQIGSPARDG
jgi:hypothetical protein